MIFPIKPKTEPEIGTIRVINRYAWLPTKVEISNGVRGWVWLEKWEERQRWWMDYEKDWEGNYDWKNRWKTIAKTLKTKQ